MIRDNDRLYDLTEVTASMKEKDGTVELIVRDNGKGITEEQISKRESFGLLEMRELVRAIGGKVEIKGIQKKGTMIIVRIPLEREP